MASTFAQCQVERDRLMRLYRGVTARVVALPTTYALRLHDIRPGSLKTPTQRLLLDSSGGGEGENSSGQFRGWSGAAEPSTWQIAYP